MADDQGPMAEEGVTGGPDSARGQAPLAIGHDSSAIGHRSSVIGHRSSAINGPVRFELLRRDSASAARLGALHTPHGSLETPAFMPVGTQATVKGLTPDLLRAAGSRMVLA